MNNLEEQFPPEFPLILHPDGTDTLYCKECEGAFQCGEKSYEGGIEAKVGGPCIECLA